MVIAKLPNKPVADYLWDKGDDPSYGFPLDFNNLAPKDKAQIFVFSPEVALAAERLVHSDTFKFPDISDIRLPYEHTIIEYPITEEIKTTRGATPQGTFQMLRIGGYLRELNQGENRALMCTPYWELEGAGVQVSMMSFCFNLNLPATVQTKMKLWKDKRQLDGVDMDVIPHAATITGLQKSGANPETFAVICREPAMQTHIQEAGSEVPLLLFACSMLLNCKSGVAQTKVPARFPTSMKYGAKRRKELSASKYTTVHLSALESVDSKGEVVSRVGTAAHYVRGHFKQRKKGLFWWGAFIRGNGEPRKRAAYTVKE